MVELEVPYPPSLNHYFSYYQGRPVLSKDARNYRHQVRRIAIAKGLKPILGPVALRIEIHLPDDRRRDADNAAKSILDALQHAGAYWDDSQVVWLLTIKRERVAKSDGRVIVQLSDATSESLSAWLERA